RTDDVLALRPEALLVRWTHAGTDRGGGAVEWCLCELFIFGADGLATRWEQFDAERDAEALARFEELTAAPSPVARRRGRAVRPNAATANAAAIDAVVAAREPQARAQLTALIDDRYEVVDHVNGITHDLSGSLATWEAFIRVPDLTSEHVPL